MYPCTLLFPILTGQKECTPTLFLSHYTGRKECIPTLFPPSNMRALTFVYPHTILTPNFPSNTSLVPRPHPRGGKGSGELGQNPWACAEEFPRANEIVALAQSYDKLTAGMQHCYTVCIVRRPIRFKVCFTAGCGHAITCKRSHSDQSEPSFAWPCRHICACAVEREPRIQPKFTRPFSSFWGWGLGTRLE